MTARDLRNTYTFDVLDNALEQASRERDDYRNTAQERRIAGAVVELLISTRTAAEIIARRMEVNNPPPSNVVDFDRWAKTKTTSPEDIEAALAAQKMERLP